MRMPETPSVDFPWSQVLTTLLAEEDLQPTLAQASLEEVMSGRASQVQIAAFLTALRAKGESAAEIAAFTDTMLAHAVPVHVAGPAVDTCGTGGDSSGTVNISTIAAIVVAACGVTVVKHGNRAASSKCGSADLLEALGIRLELTSAEVEHCVAEAGIGFCFAPSFHPAMRFAGPVRRQLGIPTVFNVLGPLSNPARPSAQLVGVANPRLAPVVAGALHLRGTRALVVRGDDGLDELTTHTTSRIWSTLGESVEEFVVAPADLGITVPEPDALLGGDATTNAAIAEAVFRGDAQAEAVSDAVCLNAGAALAALEGAAANPIEDITAGMVRAKAAIASGYAADVLQRWRVASHPGIAG